MLSLGRLRSTVHWNVPPVAVALVVLVSEGSIARGWKLTGQGGDGVEVSCVADTEDECCWSVVRGRVADCVRLADLGV